MCRMIYAGRLNDYGGRLDSVPSVHCASPLHRAKSPTISVWHGRHRRGKRRFGSIALGALGQSSRRRTIGEAMHMCPGQANDPRGNL